MRKQGTSGLPKRRQARHNIIDTPTSTDLVNRVFNRHAPNMLWLTDITYDTRMILLSVSWTGKDEKHGLLPVSESNY